MIQIEKKIIFQQELKKNKRNTFENYKPLTPNFRPMAYTDPRIHILKKNFDKKLFYLKRPKGFSFCFVIFQ